MWMSDAPRLIESTRIRFTIRTTGASAESASRFEASISSSSASSSRSCSSLLIGPVRPEACSTVPKMSIRRSSYDPSIASLIANSLARTGSTSQPVRKRMSSSATTLVGSAIASVR